MKIDNLCVFAARYAHHRKTGAALAVVISLMNLWPEISANTKKQLVKESHEATTNEDDWQRLRDHAGLVELTELSQELGMYDLDNPMVKE